MKVVPTTASAYNRITKRRERRDCWETNWKRFVIERSDLAAVLLRAGFVAADDEATELLEYSNGDDAILETLIERRLRGEPLAWIVGYATFCGLRVNVNDGVYVPRWQSEPLARRAAKRLPARGVAVDVCSGSGAIAMTLRAARPEARIVATELDERAVSCARSNGVQVYGGDLLAPLPPEFDGHVDVIVGVVPYVPTSSMAYLARDTLAFESPVSYDGGPQGVDVLRRVLVEGRRCLRPGGAMFLEVGGQQDGILRDDLERLNYVDVAFFFDDDGDLRGLEATLTM
jgi:release factor glutamine methyltransferase